VLKLNARFLFQVRDKRDLLAKAQNGQPITPIPNGLTLARTILLLLILFLGSTTHAAAQNTIWPSTATPADLDVGGNAPLELGVSFKSDVSGYVTGIRFYKGANNIGTHLGHLWSSTGTLLASATFSGETASGWQQMNFSNPVAITANTVYVASYYTNGHWSANWSYFATKGVDNPPLHALANGNGAANGVYVYGNGTVFPTSSTQSANYWVDVVFNTASSGQVAPTVTAQPASQSVIAGQSATFTVAASGTASLSYQWQRNGINISGATSASYITPTTTTADSGATFQVVVSNSAGTVTSGAATLTVSAVGAPGIQLSSSSLGFGNDPVGTKLSQVLIITNSGSTALSITQVTATGSTAFALSGFTLPLNVSVGQDYDHNEFPAHTHCGNHNEFEVA